MVQLGELTAVIDAFCGLAHAAVSSSEPWVRPEFSDERSLHIEEVRHPLLEYSNVDVVPNDVTMSERVPNLSMIT